MARSIPGAVALRTSCPRVCVVVTDAGNHPALLYRSRRATSRVRDIPIDAEFVGIGVVIMTERP